MFNPTDLHSLEKVELHIRFATWHIQIFFKISLIPLYKSRSFPFGIHNVYFPIFGGSLPNYVFAGTQNECFILKRPTHWGIGEVFGQADVVGFLFEKSIATTALLTTYPLSESFGRVAIAILRAYNLRKHQRWLDTLRNRTGKTVPVTKKETGRIELISRLNSDFTKWWLSISIFDQQLIAEELVVELSAPAGVGRPAEKAYDLPAVDALTRGDFECCIISKTAALCFPVAQWLEGVNSDRKELSSIDCELLFSRCCEMKVLFNVWTQSKRWLCICKYYSCKHTTSETG